MGTSSTVVRFGRALLVGLLCAVLLGGCLKIDADISVHEDDTISGTMVIGVRRDLDQAGALVEQLKQASPPSDRVTVTSYQDADHIGYTLTYDRAPLERFNQDAASTGQSVVPRLRRDGSFFLLGDPGVRPDASAVSSGLVFRLRLTFPGSIVDSNGKVDGHSVEWTDLSVTPYAKANASGSIVVPVLVGVAVALVLIGLAVGVVIVVRNRNRERAALAAAPATPATVPEATGSYGTGSYGSDSYGSGSYGTDTPPPAPPTPPGTPSSPWEQPGTGSGDQPSPWSRP